MSDILFDPIVRHCSQYPPVEWEYIQEQLGEDSESALWDEMTVNYFDMLTKAGEAFTTFLERDPVTKLGPDNFQISTTNHVVVSKSKWHDDRDQFELKVAELGVLWEGEVGEEDEPLVLTITTTTSSTSTSPTTTTDSSPASTPATVPSSPVASPTTIDSPPATSLTIANPDEQTTAPDRTATILISSPPATPPSRKERVLTLIDSLQRGITWVVRALHKEP